MPEEGDYAVCSLNKCKLHFECAGISETTWTNMGNTRQKTWKCKVCRGKPVNSDAISKMHDDFLLKMQETIKEQFSIYKTEINEKIEGLTESVEFVSGKIDDYEKHISALDNKVKELEKSNNSLMAHNKVLQNNYDLLQEQLDSLEQYNRNRNLQIDGIPFDVQETIPTIISKLSDIVGESVNFVVDIQAAHRVPTQRKSGVKPIIVQFTNRQKRDMFLKKAKRLQLKSTQFKSSVPETYVYVNEHLTPRNKELLYKAKQLKEKGFKYIWPKDGKVFVRKSDSPDHKTLQIKSCFELEKLLNLPNA